MTIRLSAVSSSTSNPPSLPLASSWNARAVSAFLGLSSLSLAVYAIFKHYTSNETPSSPIKPPHRDDFLSQQHRSGLRYIEELCINESISLPFSKFAQGFFQFKLTQTNFTTQDEFYLRCYTDEEQPFAEQVLTPQEEVEFFLPNLPYQKKVTLYFGVTTPAGVKKIHGIVSLTIDHMRGRYQISQNGIGSFSSSAEALPPLQMKPPEHFKRDTRFIKAYSILLNASGNFDSYETQESEGKILFITNSQKENSVVFLKLKNPDADIPSNESTVAVPLVVHSGDTLALSHRMLKTMWLTAYQWATGKTASTYLALHLAGLQQMTYQNKEAL